MGVTIRPATDGDAEAIVAVMNAVHPPDEQTTLEMFRHEEGLRRPDAAFSRLLAVDAERVVAMGQTQNSHVRPRHKFWLDIAVHADARRQGIGSELERRLRDFSRAHGGTEITANIKENDAVSRGFLEHRGYREAYRRFEMELDVSTFDWSRFEDWRTRLGDLRLFSMAEAREGELDRLFELSITMMGDVPHPDGMPAFTIDDFRRFSALPNFHPGGFFVLADGERWIGLSGVLIQEGRPAYTAFTAVDREYRGRGLATLMKLATIEFVQRNGIAAMRTTNDTVNYPMVAVNEKLGYRRLPARVAMKLTNLAAQESLEQSPAGGKVRDPILRRGRALEVKPLRGYEPEIGGWLWMMEQVRRRTLELVAGLDQETLDWEGPDGGENAIGSLLYHIALVEMSWLFLDIFEQEFPPEVKADFPHEMADDASRLARVPGVPLAEHLGAWTGVGRSSLRSSSRFLWTNGDD